MKSIRSWNCHLLSDSDTSVQKNLKWKCTLTDDKTEIWESKQNRTGLLSNIQSLWKLELESTWGRENRASKNFRIWRHSETEGKEQNCFFSKKKVGSYITHKWSSLVSTFETFADKLVSFPCIRQGSKYPSELLPSVDAFVLIAGTCDLIPSKVMRYHNPD